MSGIIDGHWLIEYVGSSIYELCLTSAYMFPVVNDIFKQIGIKVGLFDYPTQMTEPPPDCMRVLEGRIPIHYYETLIFNPNKVAFVDVVSSDYTGGKVCEYYYHTPSGQRIVISVYNTNFEDYESLSIKLPCSVTAFYYCHETETQISVGYVFQNVPLHMVEVSTLSNGFRKHVPIPTQLVWNHNYVYSQIPKTIQIGDHTYVFQYYSKTSGFELPAVPDTDFSPERFSVRIFRVARVFYPELDSYRPRTDSMQLTYFVKRRDMMANPAIEVYDGQFVVGRGYNRGDLLYRQEVTQYNTYYDLPLETILSNATYKQALFVFVVGRHLTPLLGGHLRATIELGQMQLTILDEYKDLMQIV